MIVTRTLVNPAIRTGDKKNKFTTIKRLIQCWTKSKYEYALQKV